MNQDYPRLRSYVTLTVIHELIAPKTPWPQWPPWPPSSSPSSPAVGCDSPSSFASCPAQKTKQRKQRKQRKHDMVKEVWSSGKAMKSHGPGHGPGHEICCHGPGVSPKAIALPRINVSCSCSPRGPSSPWELWKLSHVLYSGPCTIGS